MRERLEGARAALASAEAAASNGARAIGEPALATA
jgi:hypothetical protein